VIPEEVLNSIRDRIDIVELVGESVTLKRKGTSYVGLCPFHKEKTPSFNVVPSKGIFHCFGCGEGGNAFKWVQKTRGVSFPEAVKELGQRVGVTVEDRQLTEVQKRKIQRRANVFEVCEAAADYYHSTLLTRPEGRPALDYLRGRGFTDDTIKAFRLGFAPDRWDGVQRHLMDKGFPAKLLADAGLIKWREPGNVTRGSYDFFRGRVMVPIADARGKVVAFGGRILQSPGDGADAGSGSQNKAPKYMNSPESEIYQKNHILYGLNRSRRAVQNNDRLLVVEGYFDVIALHQAGFEEAVATCGTALTTEHARLIRPLTRNVVATFDADEAGLRAAERSMPIFIKAGLEPRRLVVEDAKDPDEFIQAYGADAFASALEQSEPLLGLIVARTTSRNGASPVGKQRTVEELAPIVRLYESAAQQAVIGQLGSKLGLPEGVIREWVGRARASTRDHLPEDRPAAARWQGSKVLRELFWLLIHHNDLVVEEIIKADPDPELISNYQPAQQAFALLLRGERVDKIVDFVGDPSVGRTLIELSTQDSIISAEKAKNAVNQNLDFLMLERLEMEIQELNAQILACNIDHDKSSYFSLAGKLQALLKRKNAIQNRFAR